MAARCRLLVAVTMMGYVHARRALASHFDLVPAFSLAQARTALRDGDVAAILSSIHFDESRMFDLLAEVGKMNPRPPFICCVLLGTTLSDEGLRGLTEAAQAQGCIGFFDYNGCQRQLGFDEADRLFRKEILRLLPPPCGAALASA